MGGISSTQLAIPASWPWGESNVVSAPKNCMPMMVNGRELFVYAHIENDIEVLKRERSPFRHMHAGDLAASPDGIYLWMVLSTKEAPAMSYAIFVRVRLPMEVLTAHAHMLAAEKERLERRDLYVRAAGEMRKRGSDLTLNLFSGTFMVGQPAELQRAILEELPAVLAPCLPASEWTLRTAEEPFDIQGMPIQLKYLREIEEVGGTVLFFPTRDACLNKLVRKHFVSAKLQASTRKQLEKLQAQAEAFQARLKLATLPASMKRRMDSLQIFAYPPTVEELGVVARSIDEAVGSAAGADPELADASADADSMQPVSAAVPNALVTLDGSTPAGDERKEEVGTTPLPAMGNLELAPGPVHKNGWQVWTLRVATINRAADVGDTPGMRALLEAMAPELQAAMKHAGVRGKCNVAFAQGADGRVGLRVRLPAPHADTAARVVASFAKHMDELPPRDFSGLAFPRHTQANGTVVRKGAHTFRAEGGGWVHVAVGVAEV